MDAFVTLSARNVEIGSLSSKNAVSFIAVTALVYTEKKTMIIMSHYLT